jgi:histidyl-tRNA synthetase
VLGERDLEAGEIQLKDLADGSQTALRLDGAAAAVDRAVHGD